MDLFFEILGQVAGDFALTFGADQGVYIGGGIVQRYPEKLCDSNFRKGFENKGRHSHLMKQIPTLLISARLKKRYSQKYHAAQPFNNHF